MKREGQEKKEKSFRPNTRRKFFTEIKEGVYVLKGVWGLFPLIASSVFLPVVLRVGFELPAGRFSFTYSICPYFTQSSIFLDIVRFFP
jgi:hypothetical protein